MRAGNCRRWPISLLAALLLLVPASRASAHRLDEYLQAARIAIEPDRADLELDLTPGVAVAAGIIEEIDQDRDGAASEDEKRAYMARVLGSLVLDIDGRVLRLAPGGATFPDLGALRRGEGTIHLQAGSALPELPGGGHQLHFRNTYDRDVSAYLANALVPKSDRISVTAQRRDGVQSELTIDFVARPDAPSSTASTSLWLLAGLGGLVLIALAARERSPFANHQSPAVH